MIVYSHSTGWVVAFWSFWAVSDMVEWTLTPYYCVLQEDGAGNCLFGTIKKSLSVRTATSQEATYFLTSTLGEWWSTKWWTTGSWSTTTRSWPWCHSMVLRKGQIWAEWNPPLSFKQYLRLLLRRDFWGDEVVLYTVSCMWSMKITVLNTKTLQENRSHNDRVVDDVNVVLMFNTLNHFNAMGE